MAQSVTITLTDAKGNPITLQISVMPPHVGTKAALAFNARANSAYLLGL